MLICNDGHKGGEAMSGSQLDPVAEYLPEGQISGCVLVVSDYRLLNLSHAYTLCTEGLRGLRRRDLH